MSFFDVYMRCSDCGRFISFDDPEARGYTPYGDSTMLEPPDELRICGRCWTMMESDEKQTYESVKFYWRPAGRIANYAQLHPTPATKGGE